MKQPLILVALSLCLSFVGFLLWALHSPTSVKAPPPSPFVQQRLPAVSLPSLTNDGFANPLPQKHQLLIVNFFASWCLPCLVEHPLLLALKNDDAQSDITITIIGIAYKDTEDNIKAWLQREGNPYHAVFLDGNGAASVPWGVIGVPETFILNGEGIVLHHERGPLDAARLSPFINQ